MKRIQFNTGRLYQRDGQRITAVEDENGETWFRDHSRMIDGVLTNNPNSLTQSNVMHFYDHGCYELRIVPAEIDEALKWVE